MADGPDSSSPPPASDALSPAQAASVTPVADAAPAVAPVAESAPASADAVTAPATDAPAAETKAADTVLGSDPKAAEPAKDTAPADKPAEVKLDGEKPPEAPDEPKKEEGSQSDDPAPLPTYEAFSLPEELKLDDAKLGEFTKDLAEFETLTKADHAEMQKFGQKLVDRYVAETQANTQRLWDYLTDHHEKQKSGWKAAFEADPEIGGNHKDTTVGAALEFIRTHGGNDVQQKEFRDLMESTGIGNHPAMIRILAKANMAMAEGKPLPASKPVPAVQSKIQKRYGATP